MCLGCESSQEAVGFAAVSFASVSFASEGWGASCLFACSSSSAPQVQASVCTWLCVRLPHSQSFAAVERNPDAILASFHRTVSRWQLGSDMFLSN